MRKIEHIPGYEKLTPQEKSEGIRLFICYVESQAVMKATNEDAAKLAFLEGWLDVQIIDAQEIKPGRTLYACADCRWIGSNPMPAGQELKKTTWRICPKCGFHAYPVERKEGGRKGDPSMKKRIREKGSGAAGNFLLALFGLASALLYALRPAWMPGRTRLYIVLSSAFILGGFTLSVIPLSFRKMMPSIIIAIIGTALAGWVLWWGIIENTPDWPFGRFLASGRFIPSWFTGLLFLGLLTLSLTPITWKLWRRRRKVVEE